MHLLDQLRRGVAGTLDGTILHGGIGHGHPAAVFSGERPRWWEEDGKGLGVSIGGAHLFRLLERLGKGQHGRLVLPERIRQVLHHRQQPQETNPGGKAVIPKVGRYTGHEQRCVGLSACHGLLGKSFLHQSGHGLPTQVGKGCSLRQEPDNFQSCPSSLRQLWCSGGVFVERPHQRRKGGALGVERIQYGAGNVQRSAAQRAGGQYLPLIRDAVLPKIQRQCRL